MSKVTTFGADMVEALTEVAAWKRGEVVLASREIDPMPASRIRAIRKSAAGSVKAFEEKFAVPARTLEGWEQGRRKPDLTARILLTVIERNPAAVARALKAAPARPRTAARIEPPKAMTTMRRAKKLVKKSDELPAADRPYAAA